MAAAGMRSCTCPASLLLMAEYAVVTRDAAPSRIWVDSLASRRCQGTSSVLSPRTTGWGSGSCGVMPCCLGTPDIGLVTAQL
jgi:hypothetical protein